VVRPKPNQISRIGSHAMSPIAWKNSRIGQQARCAQRLSADQDAEWNAERHADRCAGDQADQAVLQIIRQDAFIGKRDERAHHVVRTRKKGAGKHAGFRDHGPYQDNRNERDDRGDARPAGGHARIGAPAFQKKVHARLTMPQRSMVERSSGTSSRRSISSHSTPITIMPSTITSVR
jgi:hypothetical protein